MKNIRNRSAIMLGMFLGVTTLDLSSAPRTRARVTNKGAPVTPAFVKGDSVAKTGFFTLPVIAGGIGALGILGFVMLRYGVFGSSKSAPVTQEAEDSEDVKAAQRAREVERLTEKALAADFSKAQEAIVKASHDREKAIEDFSTVGIRDRDAAQKLLSAQEVVEDAKAKAEIVLALQKGVTDKLVGQLSVAGSAESDLGQEVHKAIVETYEDYKKTYGLGDNNALEVLNKANADDEKAPEVLNKANADDKKAKNKSPSCCDGIGSYVSSCCSGGRK